MNLTRLLIFSFWIVFISCEPVATFEKPQPDSGKNLEGFPTEITGVYQRPEEGAEMIVSKTWIIRITDYEFKYHQHQLDSATELRDDLLIDIRTGEARKIRLEGDSIVEYHRSRDTIFDMLAGDVLKNFRNNYFLNVKYGTQGWEVKRLLFQNSGLALQEISTKEDLDKLRSIMNNRADSLRNFNPTKRQFKQFIKAQGFSGEELFYRVK